MQLLNASPTLHWMNKSAVLVAAGLAAHGIPDHTLAEVLASGNIAPNGFLCFEKPIRKVPWHYDLDVTWDAMAWGLSTTAPRRASRSTGSAAEHSSPLTD
ncbi:Uncharacterised protein [Mycobacteroides abscessus subsp. bolletii]|uniref:hypothetical protein n=1 Tax=Mycobacteroides abscessus TaxID=36809 RepID=UPI0009C80C70|nr:hypothetical protein [Mycobacteroides abscessus]SKU94697.1 Uncharacterised protein [Mycobacteroides abscessus subsp. bolletii]